MATKFTDLQQILGIQLTGTPAIDFPIVSGVVDFAMRTRGQPPCAQST